MTSAVELLFSVTVRVSALILLAWGAARLLGSRSAALRHLVWSAAAIGALVLLVVAPFAPRVYTTSLPVWQNCTVQVSPVHIELPVCDREDRARGPLWTLPSTPSTRGAGETGTPGADSDRPESSGDEHRTAGSSAAGPATSGDADSRESPVASMLPVALPAWSWSPWSLVTVIWVAGALSVLLMMLLERLSVRQLGGAASRAGTQELATEARKLARALGLPDRVDLHLSRESVPPLSWGFWRPRILLPASAVDWPEDQRRAVLVHELGHARRRDVLTQTLAAVSCAVFWFNPLVWLAASRMKTERERACDDLVLRSGVDRASYAQCLLDLTRRLSASSESRVAVVGMTEGPDLVERVERLVRRSAPRRTPGRTTTVVSILASVAVLGTLAPQVIARPDCQGRQVEDDRTVSEVTDVSGPLTSGAVDAVPAATRNPGR